MAHTSRIRSLHVLAITLCLTLSALGCNKSEPPREAAPPAGAPPAAPAAFRVSRIDLGTAVGPDKKITAPAVAFKPNDTIYASVVTEGAGANVAIKARWTYEDGQLVNESTQMISPTGPAATEFHIAKPDGWPAGRYKLEVAANGQPAGTKDFAVTPSS
jgi:hypothetical protein